MHLFNEIFIALVALLIIGSIGLGLLISLVIFILGRQGNSPPATTTPRAISQSKRIANCTVAMSAGLTALVFAFTLSQIEGKTVAAAIVGIVGFSAVVWAWVAFRRI